MFGGEAVFGVSGHAGGEVAEQVDVPDSGEQAAAVNGDAMAAYVGDDGVERFVRGHAVQIGGLVGENVAPPGWSWAEAEGGRF